MESEDMGPRRWKSPVAWLATALSGVALFAGFAAAVRRDTAPRPLPYSAKEIAEVEESRRAGFDRARPVIPTRSTPEREYAAARRWSAAHLPPARQPGSDSPGRDARQAQAEAAERAVRAGEVPAWYPRGESPILAELVDAGVLPPVAERTGPEPAVMDGVDGLGQYGGTWLRVASSIEDVGTQQIRFGMVPTFLRYTPRGDGLMPYLAKSVESFNDGRVHILRLRAGMRWSDGAPLTAADYMFWWNNVVHEPALSGVNPPVPDYLRARGQKPRISQVDAYTIRFEYDIPHPMLPHAFARYVTQLLPRHYLMAYHPVFGDPEFLQDRMRHWGLPSPRSLWSFVTNWKNPERPQLGPWVLRRNARTSPVNLVRNPYFHGVDGRGNQLPYIDQMQFDVMDPRMIPIVVAGGGASMQERHLRFANYTEIMSRRHLTGQRVLHWYNACRSDWMLNPNQNRLVPPGDAVTAWKARLLADRRFRQALSLAIDRAAIIQTIYSGATYPGQMSPGPESPYSHPASLNAFIAHDPARANLLLDELWRDAGADPASRDGEGYRTTPAGRRLTFFLDYSEMSGEGPAPFLVDDWAVVGLRCVPRQRARPLFYSEKAALDFDLNVWGGESDFDPRLYARNYAALDSEAFYAAGWGRWRQQGGFYNVEAASLSRNALPVPPEHDMYKAVSHFEEAYYATDPADSQRHIRSLLDLAAENLWTINIAAAPPMLVVVDPRMRNVPDNALSGNVYNTPANAGVESYFFSPPRLSPGARREIVESLRAAEPMPGIGGAGADAGWSARLTAGLCWGIPILLLVLLCLRHPFVLRRLALMAPTLLLVSLLAFTVIQLPPGDFLTTRIIELEQTGSDPRLIEENIAELKELFHYNDPAWKRYLRWTGLYWFADFSAENAGLLQGNLGRSMETQQPVNYMVGDTIWLTFFVSLATILFTWALALPIGIYSAVRQYSWTEYIITFIGFGGMCVPPFLLALVLMVLTNSTGLFSPEFAAQPEWDWPKLMDLMKHIWIPVVVLGASGTAGMIRVMRANLLDELRKPYVVTARAKGMRPFRLLMKYPVRLALNPFISGIGGLFPQLVSGGAIVAMVLSLPMVGPLMLNALFTQDMNFAGSMLVVLSLLGVFGTLVSDLLLLWADPRIRLEGGTK